MALLERVLLLLCVVLAVQACNRASKPRNPDPTQPFPRHAQLDSEGDYFLYWDANATHAIFEVHARTKGWVGFGLSKNGGMVPADVMIGWVKDGQATVTDRYADARYEPRLDAKQDWVLLLGQETDFGTILKFARKLDTCDDKDFRIEPGTTKVIYAFHPDDPVMRTGLCYHGSTRGTKSLYLLDTHPIPSTLPADTKTVDFLNHNTLIPDQKTYYHCISYRFPELSQKHHIVAFEPILDDVEMTHHMVLYACPSDFGKTLEGKEYECYASASEDIQPLRRCISILNAWAVGGETLYLPENIGIPLGDGYLPNFFVLETHYNNPMKMLGKRDNSGLRIHYTRTLRPYDASMLTVGQQVNPVAMIPPGFPNFVLDTYCPSNCVSQGLADAPNQEIKIVGAMLHTHLLGRKLIVRHFRQGQELPVIAKDLNYDFDFQEFRLLNNEVVVKAGDVLVMECHYDSSGRQGITYANIGTEDEMCLAFLLYYPRASLAMCASISKTWEKYNISLGPNTFPEMQQLVSGIDWTQESNRNAYQQVVSTADQWYMCIQRHNETSQTVSSEQGPRPVSLSPYTPPPSNTCAAK